MNSSQWRNTSQVSSNTSDSIVISDTDDEIPGSQNDSICENASFLKSKSVIEETEDECEGSSEELDFYLDLVTKISTTENHSSQKPSFILNERSENQGISKNPKDDNKSENNSDAHDSSSSSDISRIKVKKRNRRRPVIHDSSHENSVESSPSITETKSDENLECDKKNYEVGDKGQCVDFNDSVIISGSKDWKKQSIVNLTDSPDRNGNVHSALPTKENDAPDIAISLAKEESTVVGEDPLLAQKRALQFYELEQKMKELARAKKLYNSTNLELLPDRGEKLLKQIDFLERDCQRRSLEIKRDSVVENIKSRSKLDPPKTSPILITAEYDPEMIKRKEMGKQAQATFQREEALTVERLNHLQQSLNRCPEEDYRAEDPRGLNIKLMPHQQHALAWLLWREGEKPPGGILADDMGLGKTLTMISLVMATKSESYSDSSETDDDEDDRWSSHAKYGRPKGGTLVVCPASLLDQWQNEITNRCKRGILTIELYHGQRREVVVKRLARNDIVITTYQIVASEFKKNAALFRIRWKRIILDEAHIIRNHTGKISEAVCKLTGRSRWALTGTPIQNKEQDLYALLKFIRVSPFNDLTVWKRWVDNKNSTGLKRLATVTKTLMLRRTKQDLVTKGILEELPERFFTSIEVNLDPNETKIYQIVLAYSKTLFAQFLSQRAEKFQNDDLNARKFDKPCYEADVEHSYFLEAQKQLLGHKGGNVKAHHILVLILRLRQICCHPGLIKEMLNENDAKENGIEPEEDLVEENLIAQVNNLTLIDDEENKSENSDKIFSPKNPIFNFDRPSSKIKMVLDTVKKILFKKEKMIIVSQWTSMLGIISTHLSKIEGVKYELFTGDIPIKKRQGIVDRFNDENDKLMILLLSLSAGGVGLNLVGGNHLLLIDIHWNPQLESQAQDRIYRFGQKKNVHIYKFLCNETIEQRVKQLQDKKINLAEDVFMGHRRTSNKLSLDDLKSIFEM